MIRQSLWKKGHCIRMIITKNGSGIPRENVVKNALRNRWAVYSAVKYSRRSSKRGHLPQQSMILKMGGPSFRLGIILAPKGGKKAIDVENKKLVDEQSLPFQLFDRKRSSA